jgi:hypothetical protein
MISPSSDLTFELADVSMLVTSKWYSPLATRDCCPYKATVDPFGANQEGPHICATLLAALQWGSAESAACMIASAYQGQDLLG